MIAGMPAGSVSLTRAASTPSIGDCTARVPPVSGLRQARCRKIVVVRHDISPLDTDPRCSGISMEASNGALS
jgi:hypothetical protein